MSCTNTASQKRLCCIIQHCAVRHPVRRSLGEGERLHGIWGCIDRRDPIVMKKYYHWLHSIQDCYSCAAGWGTQDSRSEKVAFCKKDLFRSSEYRDISSRVPTYPHPFQDNQQKGTKLAQVPWGLGPAPKRGSKGAARAPLPSRGAGMAIPDR